MELLYNPDQMPEAEVKETFVAREKLLEDLVELIRSQPDGAGVQHAVIIAPRGMGKTTVLLMVKFAVKDRGLADQWQAVKFPEESYGIYDLADLWIQTLELIAADTGDAELRRLTDGLRAKYPQNDELQDAVYAAIKDWRRKHGKRLLLLVENFDQILEQINDDRDNARLRDVLMNDGTVMFLSSATTFFKEARAYDKPLYNFFKIYDLANLQFEQMQELLRRRAKIDRIEDFQTKLKQNAGRLRALEYFTGGNPRLVLMLYRVVSNSNVTEVRRALEKLLDEVTPYYKAKVEALPAQQRKILDHIARVSGETNEGLTPKEISETVRLSQNQVSSQLKRLSELGYVQAANLRGRSSYYTLSEPLYAIWHQMRFGRESREKLRWLVNFLKAWYSTDEIGAEEERLRTRFLEFLNVGRVYEAWELLEPRMLLADAIIGTERYRRIIEGICIDMFGLAGDLIGKIDSQDLLKRLDQISPPNSDKELFWLFRGILLGMKSLYEGAIASFDQSLEINAAFVPAWLGRSLALVALERFDEAITSLDKAGEIEPNMGIIWKIRGSVFSKQGHYEKAIADFHRAIKIKDDDSGVRNQLGYALVVLDRYEEAIANYDRAFELNPNDQVYWFIRGDLFAILGRQEEAIESWRTAVQLTQEYEPLSEILLLIAQTGALRFVRKTIAKVGLEEKLFPLARAIDYLQSGDEALIEKLSPEVRGIVEEVVAKLKETSQSGS